MESPAQLWLELVYAVRADGDIGEVVPDTWDVGEEGVSSWQSAGVWYPELVAITPRPGVKMCEVVLNRDVHKAAPHAKHHGGAGFPSPFGQGVPVKGAKHRSDAALPGVIVADKASVSALGALELVCIGFGVWVPDCGGVL